jgi:hypothetical protein
MAIADNGGNPRWWCARQVSAASRAGSFPRLYELERSEITAVVFEALIILALLVSSLRDLNTNILKLFAYFNHPSFDRLFSVTVCARNEELRGLLAPQVLSLLARASDHALLPLLSSPS